MNVISSPCGLKAQTVAKMSISRVLDETKSFAFTGPTISASCAQGAVEKVTPLAQRWIGCADHIVGLARAECLVCGIKEETGPLRLRKGPCSAARGSLHGVTRRADFNLNGRFVLPAVVDAFEVTVEEPFLHRHVLRLQKGVKI